MKRSTKISAIMHKLLIEKGIDGFSVIELRDASLSTSDLMKDPDEERKRLYRQILRFISRGWLRSEGKGRGKKYFQTDLFKSHSMTPKPENVKVVLAAPSDYSVLQLEQNQYKAELEIILGEIEEYQSLNHRFPELEVKIAPQLELAKERSAHLLGKINVLTKVLKTLSEDLSTC